MTVIRTQVTIPRDTGIPADAAMNTWHFWTMNAANNDAVAESAHTQLGVFYSAIDVFLATYMGTPITFESYDLSHNEPRVPIRTDTLSIATGTGTPLPGEVAICMSYRAALISGINPARRRGRIFLGPLDFDASDVTGGDVFVDSGTRNAIAVAAEALIASGGTADAQWVVFSPTSAGAPPWSSGTLAASSAPVVAGYIDNAFDTVRSRGALPTARTLFSD